MKKAPELLIACDLCSQSVSEIDINYTPLILLDGKLVRTLCGDCYLLYFNPLLQKYS